MQSTTNRQFLVQPLILFLLCFTLFGFSRLGLDSYEIYLNKQLLLKQSVNEPLSLRKLPLEKANGSDLLNIRYRHCHQPYTGTDRSILLRDENGNALKKWKFANATKENSVMVIPVRELLAIKKSHPQANLHLQYASKELTGGETLAYLRWK